MKNSLPTLPLALILLTVFLGLCSTAQANTFDYDLYQKFLNNYTQPDRKIAGVSLTEVDYPTIAGTAAQADSAYGLLLQHFSSFDPTTLRTQNEKLAFWINAYNLGAIKMIIDHFPTDSIRSRKINFFKNPWGIKIINIGGSKFSLGQIEHEILLDRLAEPLAHFAIVCASVSCPDLSPEVYHPERLEAQLKLQASSFLKIETKGLKIDREQGVVYFSMIFKFDKKTFPDGARSAVKLISPFLADKDRSFLEGRKYKVKYLDYNWDLNSTNKSD